MLSCSNYPQPKVKRRCNCYFLANSSPAPLQHRQATLYHCDILRDVPISCKIPWGTTHFNFWKRYENSKPCTPRDGGVGGSCVAAAPYFFPNVMLSQLLFITLVKIPGEAYKMLCFYLKLPPLEIPFRRPSHHNIYARQFEEKNTVCNNF